MDLGILSLLFNFEELLFNQEKVACYLLEKNKDSLKILENKEGKK